MKKYLLAVSVLFFLYSAALLGSSFLKPCGPTWGTGLSCDFNYGAKASVDLPARITISSFDYFRVGFFSDGELIEMPVPSLNGFYLVSLDSTGPMDFFMIDASGGIHVPTIRVDAKDYYPTLKVVRTWHNPLIQLIKWYMSPVFFFTFFFSVFPLYLLYLGRQKNQTNRL